MVLQSRSLSIRVAIIVEGSSIAKGILINQLSMMVMPPTS
jgi:hypothetical protein